MGAGVSKKTLNGYMYRRLKKVQYELENAGIPVTYNKLALYHADPLLDDFRIEFHVSRASNGETAAWPVVRITEHNHADYGVSKLYADLGTADGKFEQGIARVKEKFGRSITPKQISDGVIQSLQQDSGCNKPEE